MCRGWKGVSRRPKTSPWPFGKGCSPSCRKGCCGPPAWRRPTRTGRRSVITPERAAGPGRDLRRRYTAEDLAVLTREEASRFTPDGGGDPQTDETLAWELLYRLEPELYDRLATAERLHPGILGWLPSSADRIVEVGGGTGRPTRDLLDHWRELVAIEPVAPFRPILKRQLAAAGVGYRARGVPGVL